MWHGSCIMFLMHLLHARAISVLHDQPIPSTWENMMNLDTILTKEQKETFLHKLISDRKPPLPFTVSVNRRLSWDFLVRKHGVVARVFFGASIGDPRMPQLIMEIVRAMWDLKTLTSAVAVMGRPVDLDPRVFVLQPMFTPSNEGRVEGGEA